MLQRFKYRIKIRKWRQNVTKHQYSQNGSRLKKIKLDFLMFAAFTNETDKDSANDISDFFSIECQDSHVSRVNGGAVFKFSCSICHACMA